MSACLRLAAHPLQLTAIEVVGTLYLGSCGVNAFLTILHVILEVAAIRINRLVVKFEDDVAHAVEEITVVRHHKQRLVAAREIALQPFYHVKVEVVGGLFEDKEVRLRDEHIGKGDALLLSAAQLTHGLVEVRDAELCENLLCLEHLVRLAVMIKASVEHRLVRVEYRRLLQESHADVATEDYASRVAAVLSREERQQG